MALQDHFRPPLSTNRHWHAFHNAWATYLSSDLNQQLPEGFFAEPNVQFNVEIDVATYEEHGATPPVRPGWTPPAPLKSLPIFIASDIVEVLVFDKEGGPTQAGAIELLSPANKDRPDSREAFVSKCASYLQQGVGLAVVDVVTSRKATMHQELLKRVNACETDGDAELYAAAYRPVLRAGDTALDCWLERLAVGKSLPSMPLWLRGGFCLRVDLDATYERTCREQRVLANGA